MSDIEFLVVGGGIAGASVGYWLAQYGRTVILEREAQPGYHSTGRSAAMIVDSYGPPQVRALTLASRTFFQTPPPGFCDGTLLRRRGALVVASEDQAQMLADHWDIVRAVSKNGRMLDARAACELVPALRKERLYAAVFEPDAADIDVHALHQGFLRGIRKHGGQIVCDANVCRIQRDNGCWVVKLDSQTYRSRVLINAAGAWCDDVARLAGVKPLGLVPKRRSAFTFAPGEGMHVEDWPVCVAADGSWYVKPEAGLLLGSPANADPVAPQDVQPEEMDIAIGIEAIESWMHLDIRRPLRTWAGLRSFVADGALVAGFDANVSNFFWLAGQGGYGVQTCAAMGESAAALVRSQQIPASIAAFGVTGSALSPERLAAGSNASGLSLPSTGV